jgi:predicted nucleic acid-binding protein
MMTELKLTKAFAFDHHFAAAGFIRVPLDMTL